MTIAAGGRPDRQQQQQCSSRAPISVPRRVLLFSFLHLVLMHHSYFVRGVLQIEVGDEMSCAVTDTSALQWYVSDLFINF